jgi:small-conductance mechanosensitive channel
MSMSKLQLGIAGAFAAALTTGYIIQVRANDELRAEIAAQRTDESASAALRSENQRLATAVAEVEMLRRDDLEFQQLAQRAAEMKQALDEKARVASAASARAELQPGSPLPADLKAKIERLNLEGNTLVAEFKELKGRAKDPALSDETRTALEEAAAHKFEAIKQKRIAVKALEEGGRASGVLPPPTPGQSLELRRDSLVPSSP